MCDTGSQKLAIDDPTRQETHHIILASPIGNKIRCLEGKSHLQSSTVLQGGHCTLNEQTIAIWTVQLKEREHWGNYDPFDLTIEEQ